MRQELFPKEKLCVCGCGVYFKPGKNDFPKRWSQRESATRACVARMRFRRGETSKKTPIPFVDRSYVKKDNTIFHPILNAFLRNPPC